MGSKTTVRLAAFAVLMGLAAPAAALTPAEAEAVVTIMEQLTAEIGETMSTDAAAIFYDYDSLDSALIPAHGFDRLGWVEAYDAVMAGYLAVIPEAEFMATFHEPLALLEQSELPEDQKVLMRAHMDGLIAEAQAVRAAGTAHADVVRPFEHRLHPLVYGEQ